MRDDVPHRVARARANLSARFGLDHVARLRKKEPREDDVHETQRRRGEPWAARAVMAGEWAERGAERDTSVGRGGQPAESLRALLRAQCVGHIGLNDADRPTARTLDEPRQK